MDLEKAFQDFKANKHFIAGEGITEENIESWHQIRKNAKEKYAILFSHPHLKDLTKEEFESFLYYKNNRSWTTLYRRGKEAASKIGDLKKAIAHLQDEDIDIRVRINSVLRGGGYYVRGIGKNLATATLHVCDKERALQHWFLLVVIILEARMCRLGVFFGISWCLQAGCARARVPWQQRPASCVVSSDTCTNGGGNEISGVGR